MKNKSRRVLLPILAAVIFCCLFALTACGATATTDSFGDDPIIEDKTTYTVTVFDGKDVYEKILQPEESVTVEAQSVTDKVFVGWSIEGRVVSDKASYTFVPTSDSAVNAVYAYVYTLRLYAGEGTVSETEVVVREGGEKLHLARPGISPSRVRRLV
ncbi:MAG: hypothetical protein IJ735_04430 [Clostridia bacterium]|nr:hypothetical protein [Clostridia bacterium]